MPGHNALVLETTDPQEFIGLFAALRADPTHERAVRRAGRATAQLYTWNRIVHCILWPRLRLLAPPMSSLTAARQSQPGGRMSAPMEV
jgi:hypothetical protein